MIFKKINIGQIIKYQKEYSFRDVRYGSIGAPIEGFLKSFNNKKQTAIVVTDPGANENNYWHFDGTLINYPQIVLSFCVRLADDSPTITTFNSINGITINDGK